MEPRNCRPISFKLLKRTTEGNSLTGAWKNGFNYVFLPCFPPAAFPQSSWNWKIEFGGRGGGLSARKQEELLLPPCNLRGKQVNPLNTRS